jgi:hypothetical protein
MSRYLSVTYGAKNRIVILQKSNIRTRVSYTNASLVCQLPSWLDNRDAKIIYDVVRVVAPFDQTNAFLSLSIAPLNPKTGDLPYKAGSSITVENTKFEVPSKQIPVNDANNGFNQGFLRFGDFATWSFILGKEDPTDATTVFDYQALDKKKRPIGWVDGLGNVKAAPADAKKAFEDSIRSNLTKEDYPKVLQFAGMVSQSVIWGAIRISTNVNPKEIGWIRILGSPQSFYRIDGLRLDPLLPKN